MAVTIHTSGPIFSGIAPSVMRAATDKIEEDVANAGKTMLAQNLHGVIQHPTGYYESRIRVSREAGAEIDTDGGIIYGPWLEGTGSRNRTTRFKGYHTFRRTTQVLDARSTYIAERSLVPYIARLN